MLIGLKKGYLAFLSVSSLQVSVGKRLTERVVIKFALTLEDFI